MAKVSVVIPCYNVETLIDRCLQSLQEQTIGIDNLEVICVDDCSTDNTFSHLLEWEKKYPDRISLIKLEQNGRQGRARNIGLSYATADWICFVDSDDWVEPSYVEKLYNRAVTDNYDIVDCKVVRDFSNNLTYFEGEKRTGNPDADLLIDTVDKRKVCIVNPPWSLCAYGKIIRKSFLSENNIYFPENLAYEDGYWGSILTMCVKKVFIVEEYLYHYYVNNESTVLKGGEHHWDFLTVQTILWKEWEERGYLCVYFDELVMDHIYTAYLQGIKTAILRFERPNYSYYLLIRELVSGRIGDYRQNKYIKSGILSELYELMMTALDVCLSKADFYEFSENIKKIGI